jgi:hypothetical protein
MSRNLTPLRRTAAILSLAAVLTCTAPAAAHACENVNSCPFEYMVGACWQSPGSADSAGQSAA